MSDPPPTIADQDYADDSVNSTGLYQDHLELFRSFQRQFATFIQRYGGPEAGPKQVLDIGCSIGLLIEELSRFGFQAQGQELNRAAAAIGAGRGHTITCESLADAFAAQSFDIVTMSHVLEHIPDPQQHLREVRRVLKPGGLLVLSQTDYTTPLPRLFRRYWYGWQPEQHYWHFTPRSLGVLLEKAGFRVVVVQRNGLHHSRPARTAGLWHWSIYTAVAVAARVAVRFNCGDQMYVVARVV